MSRKYDVYGIGNALLDIVVEVEDEFFTQNNVEKGLMTLVDEPRQKELVAAINLGDSDKQCGGSAANTVIAVSQFGGSSFYACKVAKDDLGRFYLEDMSRNGVDTTLTPETSPEGITGKCLVMTTPDANRTMNTFLGITETYSKDELDEEILKQSKYIYLEGYLVTSDNGCEAMATAKKMAEANDVKVALTFSDPSMVKYFQQQMVTIVGEGVDLLFCNEEEAMLYTGASNLDDAIAALKPIAKQFAITLGEKGAKFYDGETMIDIAPYAAEAIDTNGAGDLFAGAFLYGITNGYSFEKAGQLASLASSKVVTKFGPRLDKDQAQQLVSELVV